MKLFSHAALAATLALSSGCSGVGLAFHTKTPTGVPVKLLAKYSIQQVEDGMAQTEAFVVTFDEKDGPFIPSTMELPRWPLPQEWVAMKRGLQRGDQLWYFYGEVHGWCVRRAGRFTNFMIIEESPERSGERPPDRTPAGRVGQL